jgi:NAD(P)-dependent dehydrogenase (short-subunit alcohol dehydrogenase family)
LAAEGIRVNGIAPGVVPTEVSRRNGPEGLLQAGIDAQCIRELQRPEDLVGPLLFRASSASRFITGQTIVVDGGVILLP